RLTVPDSTWVMTTSAPATGWPPLSVTRPPTPAEVLWANTGAAASAAIRPIDSFDSRMRLRWVMWFASMRGWSWWRKPDARRADALAREAGVTGRSVNFRLTH